MIKARSFGPKKIWFPFIVLTLSLALTMGCNSNSNDRDEGYTQKSLGGSSWDYFTRHGNKSISKTSDGGYILTGSTSSSDGNLTECKGVFDIWVAKLSPALELEWQRALGGKDAERSAAVIETADGGYIVAGSTYSKDGDVTGYKGKGDAWVVKLDPTGNVAWAKCYGGDQWDEASSVVEVENGYIVAGYSNSRDGDKIGSYGIIDGWVFKIDTEGTLVWSRTVGGEAQDFIHSMEKTSDGGIVVVGYTLSKKLPGTGGTEGVDVLAARLDSDGTLRWVGNFGTDGNEYGASVKEAADGGFIVAGVRATEASNLDAMVMKIDAQGNQLWSRSYGGTGEDSAFGLVLYGNDIYFAGESYSDDGDFPGNKGKCDLILARLGSDGRLKQAARLGGSQKDSGGSIILANDSDQKKFLVSGWTGSNDGDVKANHGGVDIWLVKVNENLGR